MAEVVAEPTQKDVFQVYYSLRGFDRRRMRWVMSQRTLDALAEEVGTGVPLVVGAPGLEPSITLLFRPIRIDDTVEGLSYELVDD